MFFNEVFANETMAKQYPAQYLKAVDAYGDRRLNQEGKKVLLDLLSNEDTKVETLCDEHRTESVRFVDQARINNLYYRTMKKAGLDCKLEIEDLDSSFKKAVVALQTDKRRGYDGQNDQISQLMMVGRVPGQTIRDNNMLIREAVNDIYSNIIPDRELVSRIIEAFKIQKQQRDSNNAFSNQMLNNTSKHLAEKIEKFEMQRTEFVDLLELFVDNKWQNHET
jgi:hypothetical protein